MNVESLISIIESVADPSNAADWDLSGIFVRGEKKEIKKLGIALDPTLEIVSEAASWGADFLLTHHPLALSPALPNRDNLYTRILRILMKSDMWLYCAHTSLDVNTHGPVGWLAKSLELENISPLESIPGDKEEKHLGFGIIGDLKCKVPFLLFMEKFKKLIEKKHLITVGTEPEYIDKVGYCPGSGMSLAEKAFSMGAQVYISGDIKYHVAQSIEPLGYTIDVGHFILEEKMMKTWTEDIKTSLRGQDMEIKFFQGKDVIYIKEV